MDVDKSVGGIRSQCKFCTELMLRLNADVQNGKANRIGCAGLNGYTRMQEDIRRLRRELMALQKAVQAYQSIRYAGAVRRSGRDYTEE